MPYPKRSGAELGSFWNSLSNEQLLATELATDDPDNLPDLVNEVPQGDEEPYVEYKYDLRGSGRDPLHCVHGNHPHLSGFVMRKGRWRFKVGRICGKNIYGEDFDKLTADFDAAVNRQDVLKRTREIETATQPFGQWLQQVLQSDIFANYWSVINQIDEHMPWIAENMPRAVAASGLVNGVTAPRTLFDDKTDPEKEFGAIVSEFGAACLGLVKAAEVGNLAPVKQRLEYLLRRIERVFVQLREIEDFFQPSLLGAVCEWATDFDNPKKRRYEPGLLCITCHRSKGPTTIHMPKNFKLPSRAPIEALRTALKGFGG